MSFVEKSAVNNIFEQKEQLPDSTNRFNKSYEKVLILSGKTRALAQKLEFWFKSHESFACIAIVENWFHYQQLISQPLCQQLKRCGSRPTFWKYGAMVLMSKWRCFVEAWKIESLNQVNFNTCLLCSESIHMFMLQSLGNYFMLMINKSEQTHAWCQSWENDWRPMKVNRNA